MWQLVPLLAPGASLAVLTFDSFEVQAVKRGLSRLRRELGPRAVAAAKPVQPTPAEVAANPRARSAQLRVYTRR